MKKKTNRIETGRAIFAALGLGLVMLGAGAQHPAPSDAQLERENRHRVAPGETLASLASRYGIATNDFALLNGEVCRWEETNAFAVGTIVKTKNPFELHRVRGPKEFGGRTSLHQYEFEGVGARHPRTEDSCLPDHATISCRWSVVWPEDTEKCGLSAKGMQELRKGIIASCFGVNFLTQQDWQAPKTLDDAEKEFRQMAWERFSCRDATNEDHICSQWTFRAESDLAWPFGLKPGTNWYERPVLCLQNNGYANDGGNGCHSYVAAFVYRLPDGQAMDERDYFRADAMKELFALVFARLLRDNKLTIEDTLEKDLSKIEPFSPGELCIGVSPKGMTWWVSAYHIFPGCCGVTSVTIPWCDLERFKK